MQAPYPQCRGFRGKFSRERALRTQLGCSELAQNTLTEQRANLFTGIIQADQVVRSTSGTLNLQEKMYEAVAIQDMWCRIQPCIFLNLSNPSIQSESYLAWTMPEKNQENNLTSQLSLFQHSMSVTKEIRAPFLLNVFCAGISSDGSILNIQVIFMGTEETNALGLALVPRLHTFWADYILYLKRAKSCRCLY